MCMIRPMQRQFFCEMLQTYSAKEIVDRLAPFLLDRRRAKIDEVLVRRLGSIHVAVESPYDIHNALALVRSCEAFGLLNFHLIKPTLKKRAGRRTTMGTKNWVDIKVHETLDAFFSQGLPIAAAAPKGEVSLDDLDVTRPLCLLFGNEREGLSKEAMERSGTTYHIPMFGMAESLNISVAGAISLYEVAKKRRAHLKREGDLTADQLMQERAHAYVQTLGKEKSEKLLKSEKV